MAEKLWLSEIQKIYSLAKKETEILVLVQVLKQTKTGQQIVALDYSNRKQVLDWFTTAYSEWSPIWYELFESAATPFIARPIYCAPLDQTWGPLPNLTMLGDAAHVMPPFAGEGANVAMLDALKLSEYLTSGKYNTLKEAIAFFETDMRKRAAIAAKESLENGERMHSETALKMMLDFFNGH